MRWPTMGLLLLMIGMAWVSVKMPLLGELSSRPIKRPSEAPAVDP